MSTHINNLTPAYATHPGEILLDEIEANGYTQQDFAALVGMKKSQLNEIIHGKRPINAALALILEKALCIDADFWLNTQKNYDLDLARIEARDQERLMAIEQWSMIKDFIALKFFKKQNIMTGDPLEDIPVVKKIFGINHLEELARFFSSKTYAFRKSDKLNIDKANLIGWAKMVEYRAKDVIVAPFNQSNKDNVIAELRAIFKDNRNTIKRAQEVLTKAGIKLIYQEKAEKTPVDGISLWSHGKPAIGMSLRYNRIDNFAFTLFHELGHVYLHLVNNNEAEFIDLFEDELDYKSSTEETEADAFAQDHLIDRTAWGEYFRKSENYSDARINAFAFMVDIHPAIVRGRIMHEKGSFTGKTKIDGKIG
jgi:HTH-type transcriptional regulator/antitoxin HigA